MRQSALARKIGRVPKLYLIAVATAALCVALIGGGWLLLSGGSLSHTDNPHFAVVSVSSQPFFAGESVVVNATVANDEPEVEIAIPTTTELTITPDPDDTKGTITVTAVPTTIIQTAPVTGIHAVTAELSGQRGNHFVRTASVKLSSGEIEALSFDFGQVPADDYVVTVTAPSYNDSMMSLSVNVNPIPLLSEWTEIGDVAFQLINLEHDGVDVEIRNYGEHTVTFGNSQYAIFVNCNGGYRTPLQGLDKTMVLPGKTETVHANIPISGNYYLDYFAIRSPEKTALVNIPVNVSMTAA